jgi:predicted O-methyltransferase YrrM
VNLVQVPSEVSQFLSFLRAERPRRVLEIGTADGGTLYLLAWASASDARLLSLDLRTYSPERTRLFDAFAGSRQEVVTRRADSQLEATRDEVSSFFRGEPLDVLFIDGDHTYEGVRRDYELYAPLVRSGGVIAFHDIVDGPETSVGGVPRFWRAIRASLDESTEIVESWDLGGYGIGLGRRAAETRPHVES